MSQALEIQEEELEQRVLQLEGYLRGIEKGEGPQKRFMTFQQGGRRALLDLDFNGLPNGGFLGQPTRTGFGYGDCDVWSDQNPRSRIRPQGPVSRSPN